MSLRTKTLLVAGTITLALLIVIYFITQTVFLGGFISLEAANVEDNIERVINTLTDEQASLSNTAADWAHWDDTYAFIQGHNPAFVDANISNETLINLDLNFMLFTGQTGQIVLSRAVNLQTETEIPLAEQLFQELTTSPLLRGQAASDDSITGILQTPDGAALIAARPILNNKGEGPAAGTLIIGRYLNDEKMQRLSHSLRLQIQLHPYSGSHISDTGYDADAVLSSIIIRATSEDTVTGYTVLGDVYGQPSLDLHIDMPRAIYAQGQSSMRFFLILFVGVSGLFAAITWLYIDRRVMARISRLSNGVSQIRETENTSIDLSMTGSDEIANLATGLREMLATIDQSRSRLQQAHDNLEGQVSQRTLELTQANEELRREIAERRQVQSELAQARDQALEALRLRTQILANISHDARTPLSVILLRAQMLQAGRFGPVNQKQHERLESIVVNVNQLTAFINNLLDGAQMEMAQMKLKPAHTPPADLLVHLYETARPLADRKNLQLRWYISDKLPETIYTDPARFSQILANLVGNAIKFTREGQITVRLDRPDPHHWMLEVEDTGPGIPQDALAHIFDAFWQVDGSLTREANRGVGLGLSIVKQLTTLMGGQISVHSQISVGTTFRIVFALEEQEKDYLKHEQIDRISG